ncbi:MAG TPA: hypothetical protein VJX67_15175 [Blastocatellia bacterium]|nr:hypothetical protein [Blastocatellia bacterium]
MIHNQKVRRAILMGAVLAVSALPKAGASGSGLRQPLGCFARQASSDEGEALLRVIRNSELRKTDPERLAKAIEEIGRIKYIPAIKDLIGLLDFRRTFPHEIVDGAIIEVHLYPPEDRWPAIGALSNIGKPSLDAATKAVMDNPSDSAIGHHAAYLISAIFKDRDDEAILYMRREASKAEDTIASERLMHAADELSKLTQK